MALPPVAMTACSGKTDGASFFLDEPLKPQFIDNCLQKLMVLLLKQQVGVDKSAADFFGQQYADGAFSRTRHADQSDIFLLIHFSLFLSPAIVSTTPDSSIFHTLL